MKLDLIFIWNSDRLFACQPISVYCSIINKTKDKEKTMQKVLLALAVAVMGSVEGILLQNTSTSGFTGSFDDIDEDRDGGITLEEFLEGAE